MNSDRITRLLEFYEKDRDDPFNIYALAIEYLNNNREMARHYFEILLKDHAEYLSTYYKAAELYTSLEENEKADEIYQRGIELAKKQGNQLALRELQSAYDMFLFENE